MPTPTELHERVRAWIDDDPDPGTAAELTDVLTRARAGDAGAEADLADRFAGLLQFGTAGLRGRLGGGPARMNRAVVIRAAAGLSAHLWRVLGAAPTVVIGFDARHGSAVFARDTAEIVAAAGGRALLFDATCPTPLLAFAVRQLEADAGVMVTASHNPPRDNGYKVYLGGRASDVAGRGVQIVPPADAEIAAAIAAVPSVAAVDRSEESARANGGSISIVGPELVDAYVAAAIGSGGDAAATPAGLRIVLTPMHGVGGAVATRVLAEAGFENVTLVAEQAEPDPDFPTVAFPNPEEPGALDLAIATARAAGADLIIANDPDADRVSIAVPAGDGWRQLTGDEVGALLGEYLGSRTETGVFANSIVSSRLLERIAADHGLEHRTTLTGFKWISRTPGLVYGYEEALGYCVDPDRVRDKDGITAGLAIARLAEESARAGRTLADLLDDLARRHGLYATAPLSVRMADLADIPAAMTRLRGQGPATLAGSPVTSAIDLAGGGDLPPTDGLVYLTESGDRVVVRPSGTEPKIKCYLEVVLPVTGEVAPVRERAAERLARLSTDIAAAAGIG
ncbi:phospho-sugar mutase [Pseudactinotalea sp. HY160]|uniref:phospho-sugar mutase n=1 Tax=Pseudactinotalea sp. HY160 TaxID=2654490 RepID=UPI00128B1872|nr:phospho-sugar mutase [Pseudactinotalea sp. HY160]MPV51061.1 phospho-sugar mutase [Pseudactinotalea sp. HY160]